MEREPQLPGGRIRLSLSMLYTLCYVGVVYLLLGHIDDLTQTQAAIGGGMVAAMSGPLKDIYSWWFFDGGNGHNGGTRSGVGGGQRVGQEDEAIKQLNDELRGRV